MPERIKRIVVAGGDVAAPSVAAGISIALRDTGVDVRLIDDPSRYSGTSGARPGTINYHNFVRLDELSLIRNTGATYRIGTEYMDWVQPDHRFLLASGRCGIPIRLAAFHQYVVRSRLAGEPLDYDAYSLAATAARAGRFAHPQSDPGLITSSYQYGLQLDRRRYAYAMTELASRLGVKVLNSEIADTHRDATTGFIDYVTLEDGNRVDGDLFVDCSGPGATLIGEALNIPFEDWSAYLPCDRRVELSNSKAVDLQPVTRIVAKELGWQRRIQLQDVASFHLFYNSQLTSDDEAVTKVRADIGDSDSNVRIHESKPGQREQVWHGNVVAIGRAAADFEALESSSLTRAHNATRRLIEIMPDADCPQAISDEFNRVSRLEQEGFRDQISLFYALSERSDSDFWRHCRQLQIPDNVQQRIELFRSRGRLEWGDFEPCNRNHMISTLLGLECWPESYDPAVDQADPSMVAQHLDYMRRSVQKFAAEMPTHEDYLLSILKSASA